MTRTRLLAAAAVVITFCVAVGSAGGRSTETSASVVLSALIGTDSGNQIQQVTFGGKIGFHLDVANTGTSTFNHLVIVVDSDVATFLDSSQPSVCAKDLKDATRMVCKLRQMQGGGSFSVDLRFTAPASGSTVATIPSLTVDAQTQGDPGNNGTQTVTGNTVPTALVDGGVGNSLVKTFARGKEAIATGATLLQHSKFTMPDSLLSNLFGVDTSVKEDTIPPEPLLCADCPAFVTVLDIPDSLGTSSPFSAANPFTFTVTLLPDGVPKNYSPTGLYHDGALVPMCSVSDLGPTTPMCLTSFQAKNPKKNGVVAEGRAYKNGRLGFG
jgi:hypothetical protein